MPRVYVVQNMPRLNFESARDFGELVTVLDADDQVSLNAAPMLAKIDVALRGFTDEDYLVCVGDPVAIGAAIYVASRRVGGEIQLLKWDRMLNDNAGGYWLVKFDPTLVERR